MLMARVLFINKQIYKVIIAQFLFVLGGFDLAIMACKLHSRYGLPSILSVVILAGQYSVESNKEHQCERLS
jgi:hypothetical protein